MGSSKPSSTSSWRVWLRASGLRHPCELWIVILPLQCIAMVAWFSEMCELNSVLILSIKRECVKIPKCIDGKKFSSATKRDQHWLEEERRSLPLLTMICVLWNSNQWFSPPSRTSSPPPLLLRCSSTTFNLGSNCRTKLISYSNVRLGACEAPSPTAHLAPSAAVSSSCNSLDAAAISTLAPKPALDQRAIWLNMENSIMFIAKPTKLQIPRATVRDIFHRLLLRCRVIY